MSRLPVVAIYLIMYLCVHVQTCTDIYTSPERARLRSRGALFHGAQQHSMTTADAGALNGRVWPRSPSPPATAATKKKAAQIGLPAPHRCSCVTPLGSRVRPRRLSDPCARAPVAGMPVRMMRLLPGSAFLRASAGRLKLWFPAAKLRGRLRAALLAPQGPGDTLVAIDLVIHRSRRPSTSS